MHKMFQVTDAEAALAGFSSQQAAQHALLKYFQQHKYPCKQCKERFTSLYRFDLHLAVGCGNV